MANVPTVTPFGGPVRSVYKSKFWKNVGKKEVAQFDLKFDPKTGGTDIVLKDPLDLDAEIQKHKDECGMVQAQLLLKRGLARPEDFAAQPGDYGDTSKLPDNINDAYQMAQEAQKAVNVDLKQFKTDADIQNYVQAQIQAELAKQRQAIKQAEAAKATPKTEVKDNA